LKEIEEESFRTFRPPGYICKGVDSAEDLAYTTGVMRQREMLIEYARRKAAGEFADGPEVHGV